MRQVLELKVKQSEMRFVYLSCHVTISFSFTYVIWTVIDKTKLKTCKSNMSNNDTLFHCIQLTINWNMSGSICTSIKDIHLNGQFGLEREADLKNLGHKRTSSEKIMGLEKNLAQKKRLLWNFKSKKIWFNKIWLQKYFCQ